MNRKNSNKRWVLWLALISLLIMSAMIVISSINIKGLLFSHQLSNAIQDSLKNNETLVVKQMTDFEWDILYIFPPYSDPKMIDKELGLQWPPSRKTKIEMNETFCLFVFKNKQDIVLHFTFDRINGDFAKIQTPIRPEDANFRLFRDGTNRIICELQTQ